MFREGVVLMILNPRDKKAPIKPKIKLYYILYNSATRHIVVLRVKPQTTLMSVQLSYNWYSLK